jgi:hypothetical protein
VPITDHCWYCPASLRDVAGPPSVDPGKRLTKWPPIRQYWLYSRPQTSTSMRCPVLDATVLALAPVEHVASGPAKSGLTVAIWVSIVGIVVSGIVGPQITSWSALRANRRRFNRDQNARRRDDLRTVLDEAAVLLASGVTNLRLIRENEVSGRPDSPELANWRSQVFPMGQRLRLRLSGDNEVVRAYDHTRTALIETETRNIEAAISNFEALRNEFLDLARKELEKEIPEKPEPE